MKAFEVESAGRIEVNGDLASVTFERRYTKPRSAVWLALTEAAQLARWLDEAVVELRVGGRVEVHFSDATMVGSITELEDERILAYSWHEDRDDASYVRWELSDDGNDGTILRLVHSRLPRKSASGFAAGWHHHLERLASLMAGTDMAWSDSRFSELQQSYQIRP